MFADSMFDSASSLRLRRGWTTLASFGLQALIVGVLLVMPLFYTQALPRLALLGQVTAPAPPPGPPPPAGAFHHPARPMSNMLNNELLAPQQIPRSVEHIDEVGPPPAPDVGNGPWVAGSTGSRNSVVSEMIGNGLGAVPPPPPAAVVQPMRVSHMMEGNLIHRVQPAYPPLARQARIQGSVVLQAVISREGKIENLQLISGHPMLVSAAMEAVRQWRYRPYFLNEQAVEVETTVTVNFVLGGG